MNNNLSTWGIGPPMFVPPTGYYFGNSAKLGQDGQPLKDDVLRQPIVPALSARGLVVPYAIGAAGAASLTGNYSVHDLDRVAQSSGSPIAPSLKRKRVIVECHTDSKFNVYRNTFRKNHENFVFIPEKGCVVAPGPRRPQVKDGGVVCAYNSGYLISVAESEQVAVEYITWMRKKLRSHKHDTPMKKRVINVPGRYDLPTNATVWDPEVKPIIGILCVDHGFSPEYKPATPKVTKTADTSCESANACESADRDDILDNEASSSNDQQHLNTPVIDECSIHNSQDGRGRASDHHENIEKKSNSDTEQDIPEGSTTTWGGCSFLVSLTYVIINRATSEEELEKRWSNFWPILRSFISTSK